MPPHRFPVANRSGALAINLSCLMLARFPGAQRQPDASGVPVSSKRYSSNVAIIAAGSLPLYAFGLARLVRWSRHRSDEPRRARGLEGGTRGHRAADFGRVQLKHASRLKAAPQTRSTDGLTYRAALGL